MSRWLIIWQRSLLCVPADRCLYGKGGNGKDDFSEVIKGTDAEEYGGCGSDRCGGYQCRRDDHSFVHSVARPDTGSDITVVQATVCRTATYTAQTEPDLSSGDAFICSTPELFLRLREASGRSGEQKGRAIWLLRARGE